MLLLNQAAGDRAILAKQLNISPKQMAYVTNSEAGEGVYYEIGLRKTRKYSKGSRFIRGRISGIAGAGGVYGKQVKSRVLRAFKAPNLPSIGVSGKVISPPT